MQPTVIVITGATASGKTAAALDVASRLGCEIISADSRQMYRDIPIATAAPGADELARVPHHLVGQLSLNDYYSAARFETDALALLSRLLARDGAAVVAGGSMMYVDALTDGIDPLPTITEATRTRVRLIIEDNGLAAAMALLENLDPGYAALVDPSNTRRVAHALEICMQSGRPYSALRSGRRTPRPFRILKFGIARTRDELFDRINRRVAAMDAAGLEDEARRVAPLRGLNSLNTVGLKEMFAYFDGHLSRDEALARIAKNTRVYAKKQLTWLARPTVRPTQWVAPGSAADDILRVVNEKNI